jgi:hypothetical protein
MESLQDDPLQELEAALDALDAKLEHARETLPQHEYQQLVNSVLNRALGEAQRLHIVPTE